MPAKPDRILLVEGREDREVVYQFCNYHSINNRALFDVETKDGYERLRDDLMVRPLTGVKVIGAIVDADTDPHGRWHSLRSGLVDSGYTDFPDEPSEGGTIIPGMSGLPSIGIWLMPNNKIVGMLEDFLASLIHEGDMLLERAIACVDGIPSEQRRFRDTYRSKALIHTGLAWQEEPGTPCGLAVMKRYLDAEYALARQFVQWLRRLFSPP
jgi:hypothetical protein